MIKRDAPQTFEQLEHIIDKHGLSTVLKAISEICDEKADHLATNWQDHRAARAWTSAGKRVWSAGSSAAVKALP